MRLRVVIAALAVAGLLSACGSSETSSKPLAQRLVDAKAQLDASPSLTLDLKAESLPSGVSGLVSATGVVTRQPAFKGTVVASASGLSLTVPVVSVDGQVHAQLFGVWQVIDPAQYGVADPSRLADPALGVSALLTKTTNLSDGGQIRSGNAVISTIKGSLAAAAISGVITSVSGNGSFTVTYGLDDSGKLVSVRVSGPFYGSSTVTYNLDISGYGQQQTIAAP